MTDFFFPLFAFKKMGKEEIGNYGGILAKGWAGIWGFVLGKCWI